MIPCTNIHIQDIYCIQYDYGIRELLQIYRDICVFVEKDFFFCLPLIGYICYVVLGLYSSSYCIFTLF